ncbi:5-formyltetrahydrofolate cyclo-ligase [Marinomonas sp. 15G1-11]|uniref:5-formyltetrahydrofolate cyclo-ligase n=1 Tax=Marinomonas phaeophyticola TaxID=3004091 RepID=A0ABT4JVF8_9GAMM|nr:5-formyltetrahydrofolate cyclo-ligase [Marinomonas sp. 15G1-11]MCZ2721544.1 5-formyltetrahydrofolate cyclo-ligase [Marinomonas sp. 15G1-11]
MSSSNYSALETSLSLESTSVLDSLSRNDLRKHLRAERKALPASQQQAAAVALSTQLQTSPWLKQHLATHPADQVHVALYLSNDGEISPDVFCQYLWSLGVQVYLPIIDGETLLFGLYTPETQWQQNRFAIDEPLDPNPLTAEQLHLVCLPLVGFDKSGGRLGMGGGFYDKTFAHKAKHTALIGLAHDCQQVNRLPIESWDVPLDGIVTASQRIECTE